MELNGKSADERRELMWESGNWQGWVVVGAGAGGCEEKCAPGRRGSVYAGEGREAEGVFCLLPGSPLL